MWGPCWASIGACLPWPNEFRRQSKSLLQCLGGPVVLGISFPTNCVLRVQRGCQVDDVERVPSCSTGMVRCGSGEMLLFLKAVS